MVRLSLVLALVLVSGVGAQDLGRADRFWKAYLGETVRRGWPLGAHPPDSRPLWPDLDRVRADAESLEPGPDVDLLGAWMDRAAGDPAALSTLQARWPRPATLRIPARLWGETLFATWEPGDGAQWTAAWLAWEDKAYSPLGLVRGLEVLELADPSAVGPLLNQARSLYPNDRRFLAVAARHPDLVPLAPALVTRDLAASGGWSRQTLTRLLRLNARASLSGYPTPDLDALVARDYGATLSQAPSSSLEGAYDWDADGDGWAEHRLVFLAGQPVTWSRMGESQWTLAFDQGKPHQMTERRGGSSWTLRYEAYPVVSSLEYRWGNHTLVYRFAPLEASIALWPAERLTAPGSRWPALLAQLWLPLDPRGLALRSASIETWTGNLRTQTVFLSGGQVWMQIEDTNADGRDDTWSYFRSGTLASVYRDVEGRGGATLRELYRRGELAQVQARRVDSPRTEFALFPSEGVQLWDPQGRGRPLTRVFAWSGGQLQALVFSGSELPWSTMPTWEPRP